MSCTSENDEKVSPSFKRWGVVVGLLAAFSYCFGVLARCVPKASYAVNQALMLFCLPAELRKKSERPSAIAKLIVGDVESNFWGLDVAVSTRAFEEGGVLRGGMLFLTSGSLSTTVVFTPNSYVSS